MSQYYPPNGQEPPQPSQDWQSYQSAQYPPQFVSQFQQAPKKPRRRLWLALAIIAGSLTLCCVIAGIVGTITNAQPASQPTPVSQAVTSVPTHQAIVPTSVSTHASNGTATHGTPRLGGPISDFIGKYGTPNSHSDAHSWHWFRSNTSNADGLIVWQLTHPQVDSIDVAPVSGAIWTVAIAEANCTAYNPGDARQIKKVMLVDATGSITGFDVIYVSNTLASEFTPDDFTDATGNDVQRGSFDIQYLYTSDGTRHIDSCSIQLGEQQTNG